MLRMMRHHASVDRTPSESGRMARCRWVARPLISIYRATWTAVLLPSPELRTPSPISRKNCVPLDPWLSSQAFGTRRLALVADWHADGDRISLAWSLPNSEKHRIKLRRSRYLFISGRGSAMSANWREQVRSGTNCILAGQSDYILSRMWGDLGNQVGAPVGTGLLDIVPREFEKPSLSSPGDAFSL